MVLQRACVLGGRARPLGRWSANAALATRPGLVRRHASPPRALADDVGAAGTAAVFGGLVANPICAWSCWTLYSTGAGLPPGPAGLLGAAEGVSYLVVLAIVGWSVATKLQTGSGLPAGPSGLLGAVEGVSYVTLVAACAVAALKATGAA